MTVSRKVHEIIGLEPVDGDIGLEIEVEGERLPRIQEGAWRTERDSSLKAAEAYEYVFRRPKKLIAVKPALRALNRAFKENGSRVDDSYRAGVHVHINITQLTLMELANFVTLTICFEGILSEYCGESRKGNLFCLRVADAEQTIDDWLKAFAHMDFRNQNAMKYGFVNLATVGIYGSLEFRGMRGTVDEEVLLPWVETLYHLREFAKTFDSPQTIIERFSVLGSEEFCQAGVGLLLPLIANQSGSIWRDIRRAQDFAYGLNWEDLCKRNN
jgi:hypothetical protein